MNWEAIGAVGEVGGAIAVVATLGYLAVQVRHTKSEIQSVRAENVVADYNRWYQELASVEASHLWDRGIAGCDELPRNEQLRFHAMITQLFSTYVQSFLFWRVGIYPAALFDAQDRWVASMCRTSGSPVRGGRDREKRCWLSSSREHPPPS